MAPSKHPRRSVLIAARLITAAVSLAGAEGMLWFGGYPPWWAMDPQWGSTSPQHECDPDLGWRAREGRFDLVWPGRPGATLVTNWSRGRRATAWREPAADAANRPQVVFFGDSFVQGYQLSDSETLPWIVQKRHPEVVVSNFGTGDYGTYQSYLAIRNSVRGPASVYHLFNGFHEGRNAADPSWLRVYKKTPSACFHPYAELAGGELQAHQSQGNLVWPLSRRLRTVALVQDYRDILESYGRVRNKRQLTETLLVKMNQTVRAEGGKFTVILFDMSPQDRKDYRKFLASQGISFVDCDHPELQDKKLRLPDGHPNQGLNELLAQWIEPLQVVVDRSPEVRSIHERVVGKGDRRLVRAAKERAQVQ
jgi:hypothetical protein